MRKARIVIVTGAALAIAAIPQVASATSAAAKRYAYEQCAYGKAEELGYSFQECEYYKIQEYEINHPEG